MESPTKKLHQQSATLRALQGDPEAPASGTLLARLHNLQAELQRAEVEQAPFDRPQGGSRPAGIAVVGGIASTRSTGAIQRDIRLIEEQLDDLQQRIKKIDRQISQAEDQRRAKA
jgi:hypothetical protein